MRAPARYFSPMPQVFKSKVDAWFVLVILGMLILLGIGVAVALANPVGAPFGVWLATGVAMMSLGFPIWLLLSTSYTIDGGTLTVRCGPLKVVVPLSSVTRVTATRSLLSAPALSLDRLEIRYGKGASVVVSQKEKGAFLKALMDGGINAAAIQV